MIKKKNFCSFVLIFLISISFIQNTDQIKKIKKNVVDMTDADIEKLYEEWEENDEEKLSEDELPPHLRKPPPISIEDLKGKSPEDLKMMNKKGKSLMIFVTVSGDPSKEEAEEITQLWQSSLYNANYEITRYMMDEGKAIFMIPDGSLAMQIKNFLVKQERCLEVTVDSEVFPGINFQKKKKEL